MTAKATATDPNQKDGKLQAFDLASGQKIYKGGTILLDATSRYAKTNDGTTETLGNGDIFAGVCVETAENTGVDGAEFVRAARTGVILFDFSDALTQADLGKEAYLNNVTDDSVLTVTSDTGNPQITVGTIVEIVNGSQARVDILRSVDGVAANGA